MNVAVRGPGSADKALAGEDDGDLAIVNCMGPSAQYSGINAKETLPI